MRTDAEGTDSPRTCSTCRYFEKKPGATYGLCEWADENADIVSGALLRFREVLIRESFGSLPGETCATWRECGA